LFGLFLVLVAGGYALPDKAMVSREIVVTAPPDKIFAIVSDLQRSKDWSPWFSLDPNMAVTFEGFGPGIGQKMSWISKDPNVGSGSQATTAMVANQSITSSLDFGDMGAATTTITLTPETAGTRVKWDFETALKSLPERWFGLMFDRWIGADYEKGLANLKALVE
jgi:uncharacterized protein YndB with AHSA1/START domain